MANLAKLVVNLEAQTAQYQQKLEQTQRKLNRFASHQRRQIKAISSAWSRVKGVVAAYLSLRTVGVFAGMVREAAQTADNLAKTADIIGLTTEKLAALRLAATRAGSSQQELEKGIIKVQKAVADASRGVVTYKRAFDVVKLNPEDLKKLAPDEQFHVLGQALAGVKNNTDRLAAAYDILGARNVKLLKTLLVTGTELGSLEEDTKAWGTALSRVDARQIERANDAMARAKEAAAGVATRVALAIAPLREGFANAFADAAAASQGFEAQIDATMAAVVVSANFAANTVRGIALALQTVKLASLSIRQTVAEKLPNVAVLPGGIIDVGDRAKKLNEINLENIRNEIDKTGKKFDELYNNIKGGDEALAKYQQMVADARKAAEESLKGDRLVNSVQFDTSEADQKLQALAQSFQRRFETAEDAVQRRLKEFDVVANVKINGKAIFPPAEQRRIRQQIIDTLKVEEIDPKLFAPKVPPDLLKGVHTLADQMSEYSKQAARNIQDAFAEFLFDPFKDGLRGMLAGFIDTLRRMVANQLAAQIFGSFDLGGGGLLGGFSKLFGGGRATGGPVSAGKTYLVGERGPEFFTPAVAGAITPGGGGGMTFEIHNYISADSGPDADKWVPLLEQNNRKLKGEIVDEIKRGKYG